MRASRKAALGAARRKRQDALLVVPGRTPTEVETVSPAVQRQYTQLLRSLVGHSIGASLAPLSPLPRLTFAMAAARLIHTKPDTSLDSIVALFVDACHRDGEDGGTGKKLMAAIRWLLPRFQHEGVGRLPRGDAAAKATRRRAPARMRLPPPEELVSAIVMTVAYECQRLGRPLDPARALWLAHVAYLRPGELYRSKWRHLTPAPGRVKPAGDFTAMLLHPEEEMIASKTGEFNETVVIDQPAFAATLRQCKANRDSDAPLAGVTPRVLRGLLRGACAKLKIDGIVEVEMYSLRHSGPSADRLKHRRPLLEVKKRGRWRSDTSLRRYEKGAYAAVQLGRCSAELLRFAERCATLLPAVLAGSCAPLLPPSLA